MNEERASAIRSMAEELSRASGVNVAEGLKSESERDEADALYERAVDARELAHRTNQIDALLRLERDHLRPLAQSLSEYARRYHLQIVQCPWSREEPDPNACAIVSGGGRSELAAAAESVGLHPINPQPTRAADQDLWHQIAASATTVVDLRLAERDSQWPRICYALGLALSIGRRAFVVTNCPSQLPFDIDTVPFEGSLDDSASLAAALASATCRVEIGRLAPDALQAAADFAVRLNPPTDAWSRHTAQRLRERANAPKIDPFAVRRAVESHLSKPGALFLAVLSAFRPAYPDAGERRCFHVMPFALSGWVSEAVKLGCASNLKYERGDTADTLEIIDRIWGGIGRASMIAVDLTGLNPNVCLELAVARVLGRPLLLLHDAKSWDKNLLFPEIAHLSVATYDGPGELTAVVRAKATSLSGVTDR
jgi:hypothetical protein